MSSHPNVLPAFPKIYLLIGDKPDRGHNLKDMKKHNLQPLDSAGLSYPANRFFSQTENSIFGSHIYYWYYSTPSNHKQ